MIRKSVAYRVTLLVVEFDSVKERRRIGEAIQQVMAERGDLTDELVADALGVTKQTVGRWRNGEVLASRDTVYRLENYLEISHGTIERIAGYVQGDAGSLIDVVRGTKEMDPTQRALVLDLIKMLLESEPRSRNELVHGAPATRKRQRHA